MLDHSAGVPDIITDVICVHLFNFLASAVVARSEAAEL